MNENKLFAAAADLDDRFVAETMQKKARPRGIRFIAAAAAVLLIAAAFGIARAAGSSNNGDRPNTVVPKEIVLPPAQVGTEGFLHSKVRAYSLTTALENSKAACVITVGNWLSEDTETSSTYFEAEVNEIISGSVPERIVLCQYGDSKYTLRGSPLFTYGDKLLVFLKEVNWGSDKYDNCYAPLGVDTSFFYIAETPDGARYAVNHNCLFSYRIELKDEDAVFEDLSSDRAVSNAVISAIAEHDATAAGVIADNAANSPNAFRIYRLEDVVEYINGIR